MGGSARPPAQNAAQENADDSAPEAAPGAPAEAVKRARPWGDLRAGLSPEVVRLGLVSFFADVSSEMLYPITPIFLASVLHAPVEAIGLIEGIAESAAAVLKSVFGRISDRIGRRRPFVLAGYTASALAKPLIAVAQSWPLVLVARLADRFGKGMRDAPRDALLADCVTPGTRGRAFGWHRAMDSAGAVVGPLLALVLIGAFNGNLRLVILLTAIPGLIGAAIVLTVREHRAPARETDEPLVPIRQLPRPFGVYLATWVPFALTNSSDVFLILRAKQLGYSTTVTILLYTTYNVVYSATSPVFGGLSDRFGKRHVLVGGLAVFALVYVGFAFVRNPIALWPLFAIYGLYIAATDGVSKAYAVDLVQPRVRATAVGLVGTVTGIATLFASTIAGVLWATYGPWATFVFGAVGAVLSMIALASVPALRRSAS